MGKNLQKVKEMSDGTFGGFKTQVGYGDQEGRVDRKVGDIWDDVDGIKWEQKNGYRVKLSNIPSKGIFHKQCTDCKKNCINRKIDEDTFDRMSRCYYCQINFEADLHTSGKWEDWVKDQEISRWESILSEMEQQNLEQSDDKIFDESVANALANDNIDSTMLGSRRK